MMRPSRLNHFFWFLWSTAFLWCYMNSADDPSSIFFNPRKAFTRRFSLIRQAEGSAFLESENTKKTLPENIINTLAQNDEFLCIGIPSVNRTHSEPLLQTLTTISDTLTIAERSRIHIFVLLADKNPKTNIAYGAPWLEQLADDVLIYDSKDDKDAQYGKDSPERPEPNDAYRVIPWDIRGKGRGWSRAESTHLDHSLLMQVCRERGSPYFALIQDDVVASRDWFPRIKHGIEEVEKTAQETSQDWFYIRMFYSELLMGWNNEEMPGYFKRIGFVYAILISFFAVAWCARRRPRWHQKLGPSNSHGFALIAGMVLGMWVPACIVLMFLSGRVTLHRMTTSPCVREMPQYGCCAQGLVFPFRHLEGMQNLLREPPYRFGVDMIIDSFGNNLGLKKFALDPSVLQHNGIDDSSERGKRVEVWNFSFERQQ